MDLKQKIIAAIGWLLAATIVLPIAVIVAVAFGWLA